jgi:His/Glu/Gln/Arg/opine family amino acid ABC transporter permease subunit
MHAISENIGLFEAGLRTTVLITLVAYSASLVVGVLLGVIQASRLRAAAALVTAFVALLRSMPLLMVIFWIYFLLPVVTGEHITPVVSGTAALTIFYSSYIAVIVRSGIRSVPRGQLLAAEVSGLRYFTIMRIVVLPQALRNMLPALVTQLVSLFLSTSLLYVIGVVEFFSVGTIVNGRTFSSIPIFAFVGAVYLVIATGLSTVSRRLETPKWQRGAATAKVRRAA